MSSPVTSWSSQRLFVPRFVRAGHNWGRNVEKRTWQRRTRELAHYTSHRLAKLLDDFIIVLSSYGSSSVNANLELACRLTQSEWVGRQLNSIPPKRCKLTAHTWFGNSHWFFASSPLGIANRYHYFCRLTRWTKPRLLDSVGLGFHWGRAPHPLPPSPRHLPSPIYLNPTS